ncbi:hypothetical protein H310_15055 [Aphanomyces invadans]|uniref:Uncharacterized protein n=1 Tax=Aphanomyces invadans TaxID=157072 RepID=A0A024T906_9STRA|nr:hypothetical protein H310_15055 [Aphanomyces invadans]ETV90111.1 hypothetical protein H310_15055 [Aphanomyces invadans]|eukprot:XP_008881255.1 hypothetical protein H310_15055 [Aphanomyces invadans]
MHGHAESRRLYCASCKLDVGGNYRLCGAWNSLQTNRSYFRPASLATADRMDVDSVCRYRGWCVGTPLLGRTCCPRESERCQDSRHDRTARLDTESQYSRVPRHSGDRVMRCALGPPLKLFGTLFVVPAAATKQSVSKLSADERSVLPALLSEWPRVWTLQPRCKVCCPASPKGRQRRKTARSSGNYIR